MIVTCEQCHTRFKIPDEKVTEKGVKVRCTKCQHTFRVRREPAAAPADPFSAFGVGVPSSENPQEQTRPYTSLSPAEQAGLPREVFEAPTTVKPVPSAPPGRKPLQDRLDFSALDDPSAPKPFDFSNIVPSEVAQGGSNPFDFVSAPVPEEVTKRATIESEPFDFSALNAPVESQPRAPVAPPPRVAPSRAPSPFEPQPFDFSSLSPAPEAPKPPQRPAAGPPPQVRAKAPPPAASVAPPPPRPLPPIQAPPAAPAGGLLDDVADASAMALDVDDGMPSSADARASLFDMGARDPLAQAQEQLAPTQQTAKGPVRELSRPPATGEGKSSVRQKRGPLALVWNVLSFALLLALLFSLATVVLNEGKLDTTLSLAKLKALFAAPRELVAFDISNGLYETQAGRPVFYVRGEVKNRGARGGKVRVKAEILDGEDLLRAANGYVGATPSPEELYGVTSAEELANLVARLQPSAGPVEPGGQGAFLIAFYEYPPDLKGFRVRVTVTADDGKTAAR